MRFHKSSWLAMCTRVGGIMAILGTSIGVSAGIVGRRETMSSASAMSTLEAPSTNASAENKFNAAAIANPTPFSGDFPICTDVDGPFSPFCLPNDGTKAMVDSTYYVTWNADYYPINATITIELRYSNISEGDSAFTSDKTENSYGYIPLKMHKEWLQGKSRNNLTLYIIENEPTSNQRASYRQGPTIELIPKPVEHYKPPPPTAYNKLGLIVGLPISLGVVLFVVAGLYFGMRKNRRIGLGNVMGSRNHGYGIGQSKIRRLGGSRRRAAVSLSELDSPDRYTDDPDGVFAERVDADLYNQMERTRGRVFTHDVSKLKSWSD